MHIEYYPYYDLKTHKLEREPISRIFGKKAAGKHYCITCLLPTSDGAGSFDGAMENYCRVMHRKKLIPFFDFAYRRFGEGLEEDAKAVRLFAENGLEMFVAFSAAKNFSLYGERAGRLFSSLTRQ